MVRVGGLSSPTAHSPISDFAIDDESPSEQLGPIRKAAQKLIEEATKLPAH